MAQELNIGDVVELNSGGPKMTVASIQPEDVRCVWFGCDAKSESSVFPLVALRAKGNKKKPAG